MLKKFIIKSTGNGFWVTLVEPPTIYVTARRSEAKVYLEDELDFWRDKEGYEVVELPESEYMQRLGPAIAPRLPGFEELSDG